MFEEKINFIPFAESIIQKAIGMEINKADSRVKQNLCVIFLFNFPNKININSFKRTVRLPRNPQSTEKQEIINMEPEKRNASTTQP